jgi:hypothetical protein
MYIMECRENKVCYDWSWKLKKLESDNFSSQFNKFIIHGFYYFLLYNYFFFMKLK